MGADQQFCLRWNNFHSNITSAFESLRGDEDFVDITLACEGRQIKAHKMVLSACSPYFRSLLRDNPCQHPIVFLKDVTFANLTSILDFMYHGEVNVSHNELATFLKTAESLRVRGLAEDDKKKDGDTCTESSSPPPPREPPEPCSPGRPDDTPDGGGSRLGSGDTQTRPSRVRSNEGVSDLECPTPKRQRRRSGATPSSSTQVADQDSNPTNTANSSSELLFQSDSVTIREAVKNEPEDYVNDEEDPLGQQQQQQQQQSQQIATEDIKLDGFNSSTSAVDESADYNIESENISNRSQAAMQQLQDTFSSFIPMAQSSSAGFMPHSTPGSSDHSRSHPSFSLEGVQGLPPGLTSLPGSLSQGGSSSSSQDATAQDSAANTSPPPPPQAWSTTSSSLPSLIASNNNNLTNPNASQQQYLSSPTTTSPCFASSKPSPASSTSSPYTSPGYSGEDPRRTHRTSTEGFSSPARRSSFGGFQTEEQGHPSFSGNNMGASFQQPMGSSSTGGRRPMTGEEVQCTVCGRMLCNKYVLKVHMRDMHRPRSVHQCQHCSRCYSTINSLRVHVSTMHNKPNNTSQMLASGAASSSMVSPIQFRQQQQQSHSVGVAPSVGSDQQQFFSNRDVCFQQQQHLRQVFNSSSNSGADMIRQQQLLIPKNESDVSESSHPS